MEDAQRKRKSNRYKNIENNWQMFNDTKYEQRKTTVRIYETACEWRIIYGVEIWGMKGDGTYTQYVRDILQEGA
jgi:hypothetical protein